jgi:1-aminocyclopropane-1-carboxylate deaminase
LQIRNDLKLSSRLTKLSVSPDDGCDGERLSDDIWVLRDDELRGFWGSKARKYQSIIQHCREQGISRIIATGGVNSNNLAAAAIFCAEAGLGFTAFAVQDHHHESMQTIGNRMLLRIALKSEDLILVDRKNRQDIMQAMESLAADFSAKGFKCLVLAEGGGCVAAVPGAMTLADELARPRPEWPDQPPPDHVFIDSGTALTAASLAAGMCQWSGKPKTKLHVIQMAGFDEQIVQAFSHWVTPATGISWDDVSGFTRIYRPAKPRSYGATNAAVFSFIQNMARNHGIVTDPIYSAKMFMRAFDLIRGQNLKGRIVLVHTGGISGLMGYDGSQFK